MSTVVSKHIDEREKWESQRTETKYRKLTNSTLADSKSSLPGETESRAK